MIIPTGYAQANWQLGGAALPLGAEITLGLDVSGFSFGASSAASECVSAWNDNIDPVMPSQITLNSVLVKYGPTATGPSAVAASGNIGSGSGSPTSPQVAFLVRKLTAQGGRAGRGRFFLPGVTEGVVDEAGIVSGAALTALGAALDGFYADLVASNLEPVLLHSAGSPVSTPTPITSFELDNRVATQRRRLRR